MLSSNQMSAMFQQQNSGFMNRQAQAANLSGMIGMPMPPMQTAGFNYGGFQDPYGQQAAGRLGVGGVSGVTSAAPMAASGLGLAGGFGLLGGAGAYLDPMTGVGKAAWAGGRAMSGAEGLRAAVSAGKFGSFATGGLMAGAAAAVPYYLAGKGIEHVAGSMVRGAQQDYGIHQSLMSNANFYNPASRSGRGFSVAQRDVISNTVRGISEQDPFTDMGELNRIMSKAMRGNMFQNTTSAHEFGKKFKQLTKTLKSMAQVMGTSMENAMQFFDASKRMGFYNKSDIMLNTQNAMVMSGGGLSAKGIMQSQAAGAAMARSQGYTGSAGAILARKSVQGARDMFQSGVLSERDLGEMTGGLRGEQAYRSLGRQMQSASYSLARSGIGRAVYAALAEQTGEGANRRFTGKMDTGLLKKFRSGMLSAGEVRKLASQKLQSASTDTKLSFLNMEKDIAGNFAAGAGAQGWMGVINMVKSHRPGLSKEKVKLLMKRLTGMGRRQVEYIMKMYKHQDELNLKNANRAADLLRKRAERADMAMNWTFKGLMRQVTHEVGKTLTHPFERAGVAVSRGFRDVGQSFRDWALGRQTRAGTTQHGIDTVNAALRGDNRELDKARQSIAGMGGIGGITGGSTNLTGGAIRNLLGMGPGHDISKGIGRHSGLLAARKGKSSVLLKNGGAAVRFGAIAGGVIGGAVGLLGGGFMAPATAMLGASLGAGIAVGLTGGGRDQRVDQHSLSLYSRTLSNAEALARRSTDKLDADGQLIRKSMNDMTLKNFRRIIDKEDNNNENQHRSRAAELSKIMFSQSKGEVRKALTRKVEVQKQLLAKQFGKDPDDPDIVQLAREQVVLSNRGKGTAIDKALGAAGGVAGLVNASGAFDAQKIAKLQKGLDQKLVAGLANKVGLGTAISTDVATSGGGFLNTAAGIMTGVGRWLMSSGKVSAGDVSTLLKTDHGRKQIHAMLSGDKEAIKKAQAGEGPLKQLALHIQDLSPKKRAELARTLGKRRGSEVLGTLNVFRGQLRRQGSELLGLKRSSVAGALGEDFASKLLGKTGEGGLAADLATADVRDLLKGGRLTGLGKKQMEMAQKLAGMSGAQLAKARSALGGTQFGRQLLVMRTRLTKKFGEKLEDTGIMEAKSEKKIKGILEHMGFKGMSAKEISQIKEKITGTGDRMEIQKILATKAMGVKKETPMSVLSTMKGGIEKMALVSEKLLNVMLTVEEKKGNVTGKYAASVRASLVKKKKKGKK